MHTTLEAFLREAIEEILRRKRRDITRRMSKRDTIYPSLMLYCEAMRVLVKLRSGRAGVGTFLGGFLGWRWSESI
jgi:hypothetical protein